MVIAPPTFERYGCSPEEMTMAGLQNVWKPGAFLPGKHGWLIHVDIRSE
jgi:hypothetical protein